MGKYYKIDRGYSHFDLKYIFRVNQEIMTEDDCNQPSTAMSDAVASLDAFNDSALIPNSSRFLSTIQMTKHTKPARFDPSCTNVQCFVFSMTQVFPLHQQF